MNTENEQTQPQPIPIEPKLETPTTVAPAISLTEEQQSTVDAIITWLTSGSNQEFHLGGYAGTGKTTVIKFLRKVLKEQRLLSVVCAFTGKAVFVLQRKGVNAQTIHSLIYETEIHDDGTISFHKKYRLLPIPKIIIVDEASMISTELYNDLKSYGIKLLFVGDPGQLEPVGDNPNLMAKCDVVLSKIHRQAEKSPIIRLANDVRQGGKLIHQSSDELTIMKKTLSPSMAQEFDQIICARNKTRSMINEKIRQFLGNTGKHALCDKEKIIVLRNNSNFGVFNGMILFMDRIIEDTPNYWLCDLKDEFGKKYRKLPIWKTPFDREIDKNERIPKEYIYTDYAYAITCHKSQGSEWESVCVIDEWMPPQVWDMKRWRYTSITRAAKKLCYQI